MIDLDAIRKRCMDIFGWRVRRNGPMLLAGAAHDIPALCDQIARLRGHILDMQWGGPHGPNCCPLCGEERDYGGHDWTCPVREICK